MPLLSLFKKKNGKDSNKTSIVSPSPSFRFSRQDTRMDKPIHSSTVEAPAIAPSFRPVDLPSTPSSTNLGPPPAYSAQASTAARSASPTPSTADDQYHFLSVFDTVFLIDDSGSMAGRSWRETAAALAAVLPICTAHDADGVDIHFLNAGGGGAHLRQKSARDVQRIFGAVAPRGGTPTGARLDALLRPYLRDCEARGCEAVKPLNVIVITDGAASDDVESVIVAAAKRLERLDAPAWQVGVQFFQVGSEAGAAEALAELDDGLLAIGCPRDIVDTVPWTAELGADYLLKVVLGSVNRKLDRRPTAVAAPRGRRA